MSADVLLVVLESEVLFHEARFQNCVILQMCDDLIQTEHIRVYRDSNCSEPHSWLIRRQS